jgi:hypothetical protein
VDLSMLSATRQWSARKESVESAVTVGLATAAPTPGSAFIVGMTGDGSIPGCGGALAVGAAAVDQLRITRR